MGGKKTVNLLAYESFWVPILLSCPSAPIYFPEYSYKCLYFLWVAFRGRQSVSSFHLNCIKPPFRMAFVFFTQECLVSLDYNLEYLWIALVMNFWFDFIRILPVGTNTEKQHEQRWQKIWLRVRERVCAPPPPHIWGEVKGIIFSIFML